MGGGSDNPLAKYMKFIKFAPFLSIPMFMAFPSVLKEIILGSNNVLELNCWNASLQHPFVEVKIIWEKIWN